MKESDIKNYINTQLQTLVPTTLKTVLCNDFKTDYLSTLANTNSFPLAIITPAEIQSEVIDSNNNRRTYTFQVLIIQKGENLQSSTDLENIRQTVMDLFDEDLTFGGIADGGILPASTAIDSITHADLSWVGFAIFLKPKALIPLS